MQIVVDPLTELSPICDSYLIDNVAGEEELVKRDQCWKAFLQAGADFSLEGDHGYGSMESQFMDTVISVSLVGLTIFELFY
jgi:hypothetical protein